MIDKTNYFFSGAFIFEACLKIYTLRANSYFHNSWNKFDFFVVVASILDLISE